MKPTLRDYLTILLALLVIFLCGYGTGFLICEKKARKQTAPSALIKPNNETGEWENRTMERLSSHLNLSESQKEKIEAEVKTTSARIQASRDETVENYYRMLLDLHDQLLPFLEPEQQEKIKKDRKSLQQAIDSRF